MIAARNPLEGALAGPETRLGQLQRGRGAGFRAALAAGEDATADGMAAATLDARWDRQVESRALYHAALLHALGADPRPLAAHATGDDLPLLHREAPRRSPTARCTAWATSSRR